MIRREGTNRGDSQRIHRIGEEANVQYPFEQVEAVWASLGEEAKGRLRMGFDAARWRIVVPFPLAAGIPKRATDR